MKTIHGSNNKHQVIIKMDMWTLFWPSMAVIAVAAIGALL
jgi:hypothetical protein